MLSIPLPNVNLNCFNRNFLLDLPNIEITSLDITSSGCFILVGCSNGMVILFDMTSNDRFKLTLFLFHYLMMLKKMMMKMMMIMVMMVFRNDDNIKHHHQYIKQVHVDHLVL